MHLAEDADQAARILAEMEARGCMGDIVCFSALMHVFNKTGRYEAVLELGKTLNLRQLSKTEVAFNELLMACCRLVWMQRLREKAIISW